MMLREMMDQAAFSIFTNHTITLYRINRKKKLRFGGSLLKNLNKVQALVVN